LKVYVPLLYFLKLTCVPVNLLFFIRKLLLFVLKSEYKNFDEKMFKGTQNLAFTQMRDSRKVDKKNQSLLNWYLTPLMPI